MRGLAILFGFNFLGYVLHAFHVPLPGNVIGMILLTVALFTGWVKVAWIEESAEWLLKNMMLFFAPIIVGTVTLFQQIGEQVIPIVVSLVGSTVAVLLVTGWTVQALQRDKKRGGS